MWCRSPGLLPATRFAVDAYVHFVRDKTLLEAVASSLTELFSPQIIGERVEGMLKSYEFVSADTLAYFSQRPPLAQRDSEFALELRQAPCQDAGRAARPCSEALEFKCDVLWAMLDALYHAYVAPRHVPPGAFVPEDEQASDRDESRHPPAWMPMAAAAARRAPRPQRGARRLGAARSRTGVQGRRNRGRDHQALHRRGHLRRRSSTIWRNPMRPRASEFWRT